MSLTLLTTSLRFLKDTVKLDKMSRPSDDNGPVGVVGSTTSSSSPCRNGSMARSDPYISMATHRPSGSTRA